MVRKKRSGEESGEEASPLHFALTAMPLALVFQRDPTLRLDGNQSEGYRNPAFLLIAIYYQYQSIGYPNQ